MKPQKCSYCGLPQYDTEDIGIVCDKCLSELQRLEKENEQLRLENERLKEWEVKGYWGP